MSSSDPSYGSATDNEQEPDAREQLERWLGFLQRARHFWPAALGTVLLGCVAGAVFLYLRAPRYRSETVIFYAEKSTTPETDEPGAARSVTLRLKELLESRATLEHIVRKFDPYPELRRTLGPIEAVEELKKHIDFRAPGGDTISIAFEGSSPNQAQRITAELARLVIDSDSELRKSQAHAVQQFLVEERQGSESQLRDAEQKLAAFMAQHPRFALDATPLSNGAAIRATLGAPGAGPMLGRAMPLRLPLPSDRPLGSVCLRRRRGHRSTRRAQDPIRTTQKRSLARPSPLRGRTWASNCFTTSPRTRTSGQLKPRWIARPNVCWHCMPARRRRNPAQRRPMPPPPRRPPLRRRHPAPAPRRFLRRSLRRALGPSKQRTWFNSKPTG